MENWSTVRVRSLVCLACKVLGIFSALIRGLVGEKEEVGGPGEGNNSETHQRSSKADIVLRSFWVRLSPSERRGSKYVCDMCVGAMFPTVSGSVSVLFRVTEQATHTDTPLFKRKPNTKVRWRSQPLSQPSYLRRMAPQCPPCCSMPRSSRRRRPVGSTHPTPTCGSMWLMRSRGAWAPPGPRPQ